MASRHRGGLTCYRIADNRFPIFNGTGAALTGGRWNSPGRRVIYASQTYAGAMLEILVHAGGKRIPRADRAVVITVPANVELEVVEDRDVAGWERQDLTASRAYGDRWLTEERTAVLVVPSVVIRAETNILINPDHPKAKLIKASKPALVIWDERLFRRLRK